MAGIAGNIMPRGVLVQVGYTGEVGITPDADQYKSNVTPISIDKVDKLLSLTVSDYVYTNKPSVQQTGVSASQVASLLPDACMYTDITLADPLAVRWPVLNAIMLKGLQRQQADLNDLEDSISTLEGTVSTLTSTTSALGGNVTALTSTVSSHTSSLSSLTNRVTSLESAVSVLQSGINQSIQITGIVGILSSVFTTAYYFILPANKPITACKLYTSITLSSTGNAQLIDSNSTVLASGALTGNAITSLTVVNGAPAGADRVVELQVSRATGLGTITTRALLVN